MDSSLASKDTEPHGHRSNHAYEPSSLSWSSSLPSLTSTSSSMTSVSLNSRTSELDLLGRAEEQHETHGPYKKRTERAYHTWIKSAFAWDGPSSSASSYLDQPSHHERSTRAKNWKAYIARTTLWDRVVFVLFWISLWTLLRALAGLGDTRGPVGRTQVVDTLSLPSQPIATPLLLPSEQNTSLNTTIPLPLSSTASEAPDVNGSSAADYLLREGHGCI